MAVLLALGSAVFYALQSVLQQKAASAAPIEQSLRPGLLLHLLRRPMWLAGTAADVVAICLHFLALRSGSLVLVQPLLITSVLFALPVAAVLFRHPLTLRHWVGAVQVVVGLSVFLIAASPEPGDSYISGSRWLIVGGIVASAVLTILVFVPRQPGRARAGWLGIAAGLSYALLAALLKATAEALGEGLGATLTSWEPYALLGFGVFGLLLGQSAFQAGPLQISMPLIIAVDPVVSVILGLAFGEDVAQGGVLPAVQFVSLLVLVLGALSLGRAEVALMDTEKSGPLPSETEAAERR